MFITPSIYMNLTQINPNQRRDPVLGDFDWLSGENAKRIFNIATPIISLYQPAAKYLALCSSVGQVIPYALSFGFHYVQGEEEEMREEFKLLALLVSSTALTFFRPRLAMTLTYGYSIVRDINAIKEEFQNAEYLKTVKKLLALISTGIYLGSFAFRTPEMLMASLLLQAFQEFYRAYQYQQEGKYLECASNCFLGVIRSAAAKEQGSLVYRNHFGKKLTQESWDEIMEEARAQVEEPEQSHDIEQTQVEESEPSTYAIQPQQTAAEVPERATLRAMTQNAWNKIERHLWRSNSDVESLLKTRNYSSIIRGITIDGEDLDRNKYRNLQFIECTFQEAEMVSSHFENVIFKSCRLPKAQFTETTLSSVRFLDSDLSRSIFYKAKGNDVLFQNCDLSYTCFNNSTFSRLQIIASNLFGANFLQSNLQGSFLKNCNLTDVLLADAKFEKIDCTKNQMTRLVIALGWSFNDGGGQYISSHQMVIEGNGALCLKHSNNEKMERINDEVDQALETYEGKGMSRVFHVLNQKNDGDIGHVKKIAETILTQADGVIIPGGADVPRVFYSNGNRSSVNWRTIIELALIKRCWEKKQPLFGVCRGLQITNVALGGTLKNVRGQHVRQKLTITNSPLANWLRKNFGAYVSGSSMHSQAADRVSNKLRVVLKYRNIIKALMTPNRNFLLTQFHPEQYLRYKKIVDDIKAGKLIPQFGRRPIHQYFRIGNGKKVKIRENRVGHLNRADVVNLKKKLEVVVENAQNQKFFELFMNRAQAYRARAGASAPD